jgi:hypothetical protein
MQSVLVPIKRMPACPEDLVHGGAAGAQRSHRSGTCERDQTLHGSGGPDDGAGFHDGFLENLVLCGSGLGYDGADCK